MKDRIYVCHTFYHAYIAAVKELNKESQDRGNATLMLSIMSNDFGTMTDRARQSGLFEEVILFDEKEDAYFPEVMKYHADKGNIFLNLIQRIKYTKALGRAEEEYIPVDFKKYKEVYVFCDSDPIGYYLNYKKIHYHAVEDGLDTLKQSDDARYGNRGHFELKAWMAKHNLIFIENGYSKYCDDFEVNDLSVIKYVMPNFIEVPRRELMNKVADSDKHYLMDIFMDDAKTLLELASQANPEKKKVMILSDPVCDDATRKKIMQDIIEEYAKDATVFIKQHPRDLVDYSEACPNAINVKGRFPMEVLDMIPELHMDLLISIWTVVTGVDFADEKILLGVDFMDKYEDPSIHRPNEVI